MLVSHPTSLLAGSGTSRSMITQEIGVVELTNSRCIQIKGERPMEPSLHEHNQSRTSLLYIVYSQEGSSKDSSMHTLYCRGHFTVNLSDDTVSPLWEVAYAKMLNLLQVLCKA